MKNKTTTTTLHDGVEFNNSRARGKAGKGQVWKLGLDVDLRQVAVATQCGQGAISLGRKMAREQLLAWVKGKTSQGDTVYTVYECCGFGYDLARAVEPSRRSFARDNAATLKSGVSAEERSDGQAGVMRAPEPVSGWTEE